MVRNDKKIIDRILNKAVEEILPSKDALQALLNSGKRLRIYQGFDPTAPTLHIGHSVMMRKLEDFRKLGHQVIFLIGDFTARIGDPTDKGATRKKLTKEEISENLKMYTEQAKALIDVDNKENPVQVMFNSSWLEPLNFGDIIELASSFTVQQMIKRSMFQKRLEEDKPIYLHEFLYPLMQGYDSVAMDVDVELGGNDQLFNMLAGRDLMMALKNKEKFVIAGKLLTTADGKKMGKSEGNMITLADSAQNIYGKVMAFPDEHIVPGFELLTSMEIDDVEEVKQKLKQGVNPIELKKALALQLTSELKGKDEAEKAQQYFEEVFQKKGASEEAPKHEGLNQNIVEILLSTKIASSKSEARRLLLQNAVKLEGEVITDPNIIVTTSGILKVGKKVFHIV